MVEIPLTFGERFRDRSPTSSRPRSRSCMARPYRRDCAALVRTRADGYEERFGCGTGEAEPGVPQQQRSGSGARS